MLIPPHPHTSKNYSGNVGGSLPFRNLFQWQRRNADIFPSLQGVQLEWDLGTVVSVHVTGAIVFLPTGCGKWNRRIESLAAGQKTLQPFKHISLSEIANYIRQLFPQSPEKCLLLITCALPYWKWQVKLLEISFQSMNSKSAIKENECCIYSAGQTWWL